MEESTLGEVAAKGEVGVLLEGEAQLTSCSRLIGGFGK